MAEQKKAKFPETVNPEDMEVGKSYLRAVRHTDTGEFEILGPFRIEGRPRRHKEGLSVVYFKAYVFIETEQQRLPRDEIALPLAGHSSLYGKKMSLHPFTDDVVNYFIHCNKNTTAPECQVA